MVHRHDRVPRMNYRPRIVMHMFAGSALLASVPGALPGPLFWAAFIAQFVFWPHVAWGIARRSRDPKQAEVRNMNLDCVAFGVWTAVSHFHLGLALLYLGSNAMTHLTLFGPRMVVRVLWLTAIGWVIGGAMTGFQMQLSGGLASQAFAYIGLCFVMSVVGISAHRQNRQLLKIKQSVEQQKGLFEALLHTSATIRQSADIDALLRTTLARYAELLPDMGFGIVLHDIGRPGAVRHVHLPGMTAEDADAVMRRIQSASVGDAAAEAEPGHDRFRLFSMKAHLTQLEGVLIVRTASAPRPERLSALMLLCDQIASALESSLLTLKLQRQAHNDALTGAYNRAYYMVAFEAATQAWQGPAKVHFTVVNIDVNGLKGVNDNHGHEAGDAVIISAAELLRRVIRESDLLFRLGGDEFVILCSDCDHAEAQLVTNRIRTEQAHAAVKLPGSTDSSTPHPLRMSIGCASTDEFEVARLAQVADERMYADKQAFYQARGLVGVEAPAVEQVARQLAA